MSHEHHESLPGYHESNVLHDGCHECDVRARSLDGILSLDKENLDRLWLKMWNAEFRGASYSQSTSYNDRGACRILYTIGVALEKLIGREKMLEAGLPWG